MNLGDRLSLDDKNDCGSQEYSKISQGTLTKERCQCFNRRGTHLLGKRATLFHVRPSAFKHIKSFVLLEEKSSNGCARQAELRTNHPTFLYDRLELDSPISNPRE